MVPKHTKSHFEQLTNTRKLSLFNGASDFLSLVRYDALSNTSTQNLFLNIAVQQRLHLTSWSKILLQKLMVAKLFTNTQRLCCPKVYGRVYKSPHWILPEFVQNISSGSLLYQPPNPLSFQAQFCEVVLESASRPLIFNTYLSSLLFFYLYRLLKTHYFPLFNLSYWLVSGALTPNMRVHNGGVLSRPIA